MSRTADVYWNNVKVGQAEVLGDNVINLRIDDERCAAWIKNDNHLFDVRYPGETHFGTPKIILLEKKSDRFVSPCEPPTPFQRELAELIIEECAEAIQRATKLLRFGILEIEPGQPLTNATRLSQELGDLAETIRWADRAGVMSRADLVQHMPIKNAKLRKFLQHIPDGWEIPI